MAPHRCNRPRFRDEDRPAPSRRLHVDSSLDQFLYSYIVPSMESRRVISSWPRGHPVCRDEREDAMACHSDEPGLESHRAREGEDAREENRRR